MTALTGTEIDAVRQRYYAVDESIAHGRALGPDGERGHRILRQSGAAPRRGLLPSVS